MANDPFNHPFFMDSFEVDPNQPLTPELEALQALKYESENPLENARSYREEGNHLFKKKDFQKALVAYTAGLQLNCGDSDMQAALFLNRATSHFHLGNFRKCIIDSEEALKLNPNYPKAHLRIAESFARLHRNDEVVKRCEASLRVLGDFEASSGAENSEKAADANAAKVGGGENDCRIVIRKLQELKTTVLKRIEAERVATVERAAAERSLRDEHESLLKELRKREVHVSAEVESGRILLVRDSANREQESGNWYAAQSGHVGHAQISYDEQRKELRWPIVVFYPQFRQSDMLTDVYDSDDIAAIIRTLLPETRSQGQSPEWDRERLYSADHVETWFEHEQSGRLVRVAPTYTVLQLATHPGFVLPRFGVIRLLVLLDRRESQFAREYVDKCGIYSE